MIPLDRLACPDVLAANSAAWTQEFLTKRAREPGSRPDSRRYAHEDVLRLLRAMSRNKCFYCEASVRVADGVPAEVDHRVPLADDPTRAFDWLNLYLCCRDCNQAKRGRHDIDVRNTLDPCEPGVRPDQHLAFATEQIRAAAASTVGRDTIDKFRLDRTELDLRRLRQLQYFVELLWRLTERARPDGRDLDAAERAQLHEFVENDQPFALMFRVYFARHGLPY